MLPDQRVVSTEGTLTGESIAMSIDEHSLAHIMGVLTDLYSDPAMAVIREYSTNALDSHIMAGETRPIEVTLPSALNPVFRVKDYGVGLSVNEISQIYSRYGASTKRDTNTQVGMLGLGGKSALTYTNQFTIIAVQGGVKTSVSVSRREDGIGVMDIIDTSATTDPNGVEVIIPTPSNHNAVSLFSEKATNFFKYWQPGQALVNGKDLSGSHGDEVAPGIFVRQVRSEHDVLVMGGVAYSIDFDVIQPMLDRHGISRSLWSKTWSLTVFVDVGSVNFTPSRESLHMTSRTRDAIRVAVQDFAKALPDFVKDAVSGAKDYATAAKNFSQYVDMFGQNLMANVSYNGHKIPVKRYVINDAKTFRLDRTRGAAYRPLYYSGAEVEVCDTGVLIVKTKNPPDSLTPTQKNKIRQYISSRGLTTVKRVVFTDSVPGSPWNDDIPVVDWDVVKAIKLPNNSVGGYVKGSIPLKTWSYGRLVSFTGDLDPDDKILMMSPTDDRVTVPEFMGYKVIVLGYNRFDKFKRSFKNAVRWSEMVKQLNDEFASLVPSDEQGMLKTIRYRYSNEVDALRNLPAADIDDPGVKALLQLRDRAQATMEALPAHMQTFSQHHLCDYAGKQPDLAPLRKYPLIDQHYLQESINYINLTYGASK